MYWTRWNPVNPNWFNDLGEFRNEVNRFLERLNVGLRRSFPACNVWEEDDAVHLEAELPGVNLEDLEIFVNNNELTIQGQRKLAAPEKSVQHRQERSFGDFSRTLALPVPVDADKVDARLDNGVLKIRLAKHEQARPRKINVKG